MFNASGSRMLTFRPIIDANQVDRDTELLPRHWTSRLGRARCSLISRVLESLRTMGFTSHSIVGTRRISDTHGFESLEQAKRILEAWRRDYNDERLPSFAWKTNLKQYVKSNQVRLPEAAKF
jgi:hypothetical protein